MASRGGSAERGESVEDLLFCQIEDAIENVASACDQYVIVQ